MTSKDEAERLASQLKERYGATVPTSQAAAILRSQAAEIEILTSEREAYASAMDRMKVAIDRKDALLRDAVGVFADIRSLGTTGGGIDVVDLAIKIELGEQT